MPILKFDRKRTQTSPSLFGHLTTAQQQAIRVTTMFQQAMDECMGEHVYGDAKDFILALKGADNRWLFASEIDEFFEPEFKTAVDGHTALRFTEIHQVSPQLSEILHRGEGSWHSTAARPELGKQLGGYHFWCRPPETASAIPPRRSDAISVQVINGNIDLVNSIILAEYPYMQNKLRGLKSVEQLTGKSLLTLPNGDCVTINSLRIADDSGFEPEKTTGTPQAS